MEAAALLTNALVRALKTTPDCLSDEAAARVLAEVHDHRYERAKELVAQAHTLQALLSQRSRFSGLITKHIIPLFGPNAFVDVAVPICVAGAKVDGLVVPTRPRFVPFEDELPARPIKGALVLRSAKMLA